MKTKLFIALLIAGITVTAQDSTSTETLPAWEKGATFGVQFTQSSFHQWVAGGQNSYSYAGFSNFHANYSKGKTRWDNTLDMNYGSFKQGNTPLVKSDDRVEFNSVLASQADQKWYYAGQLNYRTQFTPGYLIDNVSKVRISDFLAPAYVTFSLGMEFRPKKDLSWLISPMTVKSTMVFAPALAALGVFGLEPGENVRSEFGGLTRVTWKDDLMDNVNIITNLTLFSNYSDKPQNIDINWDMLLVFRVNKYLNFTFNTVLIYDHDVDVPKDRNNDGIFESRGKGVQFKEIFALGFSYSFAK
ncbi:MAG: hypothetical protein ACJA0Q_001506 [Saprospiraceae bacterium]|jgi:hypothetical protein